VANVGFTIGPKQVCTEVEPLLLSNDG
jgi:hypothetical protein